MFVTVNGGDSWTSSTIGNSGAPILNVFFTDLGVGYYAGNNGVFGSITDFAEYFSDRFYYDKLGRLVASQNAKQYNLGDDVYSYTIYDELGRIKEVGEINADGPIEENMINNLLDQDLFEAWLNTGNKREVSRTYYDNPMDCTFGLTQDNLRSRVSSVTFEKIDDEDPCTFDHASHYSYDVHGNVKKLVQHMPFLQFTGDEFKILEYEYDLVSGNVLQFSYQKGEVDQFHHKYTYDADNRIQKAYTSTNGYTWTEEVAYEYYRHGPLKRQVLGDWKVQGVDYAYTVQGWLKGVNSNTIWKNRDIGRDGLNSPLGHNNVAVDAYGFSLGYYNGDYSPIGNLSTAANFEANINGSYIENNMNQLYNGNISYMVTSFASNNTNIGPLAMIYDYDQLNRIVGATSYTRMHINNNVWLSTAPVDSRYNTTYSYDANGNIDTLSRRDHNGVLMDTLIYKYHHDDLTLGGEKTNRLLAVLDGIGNSGPTTDLEEGQMYSNTDLALNNYVYDEIGNLVEDKQEQIANIDWTVSGKVKRITRSAGSIKPDLEFFYDASGNRIRKITKPRNSSGQLSEDKWIETIYINDAQGNTITTYSRSYQVDPDTDGFIEILEQDDIMLYGSDRIGVYNRDAEISKVSFQANLNEGIFEDREDPNSFTITQEDELHLYKGDREYELKNHLGNVLLVINDNKEPVYTNSNSTSTIFSDHFEESSAPWTVHGEANLTVMDGKLIVTPMAPGSGIRRVFNYVEDPACSYEFCFEFSGALPAELHLLVFKSDGTTEYIPIRENGGCIPINPGEVSALAFVDLGAGGQFALVNASLKATCNFSNFNHYKPIVKHRNDYYPFGMLMPGRGYTTADEYRYGFNGMERDDEVKGSGNSYDFGSRIYDPRIGRWMSLDLQMMKFPDWSPYQFAFNNPIIFKDKNGEVPIIVIDEQSKTIVIYQPIFVVTNGPGAVKSGEITALQKEFNDNISANHLEAISNTTGKKYDIVVQFQFYEGGTFDEASQKSKEATKRLGMPVYGTYSSFTSDSEFNAKYKSFGGEKDPSRLGGFTVNSKDIYMRASVANSRERIHEGFHLLYGDDSEDAVGIFKYTNAFGKGPGVNSDNIEEVLNKSMKQFSSILRFNENGKMTQGDVSGESFSVKEKIANPNTSSGSGMEDNSNSIED